MSVHPLKRLQRIVLVGMSPIFTGTVAAPADNTDEDVDNSVVTGAATTNALEKFPNTTAVMRLPAYGRDHGFDFGCGLGKLRRWAR